MVLFVLRLLVQWNETSGNTGVTQKCVPFLITLQLSWYKLPSMDFDLQSLRIQPNVSGIENLKLTAASYKINVIYSDG